MTDPKPTVTIPLDVAEQIARPPTESQRRRAAARLTDAMDPSVCRAAGRQGRWHRAEKYSGWFDCGTVHHAALICDLLSRTPPQRRCRRCFPPAPAVEV